MNNKVVLNSNENKRLSNPIIMLSDPTDNLVAKNSSLDENKHLSNPIITLNVPTDNPIAKNSSLDENKHLTNPLIELTNPIIMQDYENNTIDNCPNNSATDTLHSIENISSYSIDQPNCLKVVSSTTELKIKVATPITLDSFICNKQGFSIIKTNNMMIYNNETLANFTIEITKIIKTVNLTTNKKDYILKVIVNCPSEQIPLSVPKEDYNDLPNKILKEIPGVYRFSNILESNVKIKEYLAKIYNDSINRNNIIEEKLVNTTFGWVKYKNRIFFAYDGDGITTCKKTLPPLESENHQLIINSSLGVLNIAPPQISLCLFIYSHMGILRKLWEDAKYPVNFICFILGKTGSYKTSVASELFNVFSDEKNQNIINAYSTLAGIERMASNTAKDDFIILDDIRPPLNKSEEVMIKSLLEAVVRMSGDISSRCIADVTTSDREKKTFKEAMFVATGEVLFGSLSSILRMLKIEIQRDQINTEVLSWLKSNKTIYKKYFLLFIKYVETNYNDIVKYFSQNFPNTRNQYQNQFKNARTAEQMSHLETTMKIMCVFYQSNEISFDSNIFSQYILQQILSSNENESETLSPVQSYLLSLHQLIANEVVVVSETMERYKENMQNFIGYYHENQLWLKHEDVFKAIQNHLSKQNNTLFAPATTIHKELVNSGISIGNKNRNLKRSSVANRPEMLCINFLRFQNEVKKILGDD